MNEVSVKKFGDCFCGVNGSWWKFLSKNTLEMCYFSAYLKEMEIVGDGLNNACALRWLGIHI